MLGSRVPRLLLFGALICFAIAFVNRNVYPTRTIDIPSSGWTAYAPVDDPALGRFDDFELWDPYLWMGGGIALIVAAACVVGAANRRGRA